MTQTIALVTGADRGLGFALCKGLLERGWRVFAGQYLPEWPELGQLTAQYPQQLTLIALDVSSIASTQAAAAQVARLAGRVDLLINNAGVTSDATFRRTIREGQDYAEIHRIYNVNALGPLRVVEEFLPLMDGSALKRLCFVSSEAGSIARSTRTSWYGYTMSKAALNMAVKVMFNDLRPQGFSFRLYHPGWIRSYLHGEKNSVADLEPEEAAVPALDYFLGEVDEDQLVLRDEKGQQWAW